MDEQLTREALNRALENKELLDEMEKANPGITGQIKAELAGAALHSWLPSGFGRKFVMLVIAGAGIGGAIMSSLWWLLLLLLLPTFSPRLVGEYVRMMGLSKRKITNPQK